MRMSVWTRAPFAVTFAVQLKVFSVNIHRRVRWQECWAKHILDDPRTDHCCDLKCSREASFLVLVCLAASSSLLHATTDITFFRCAWAHLHICGVCNSVQLFAVCKTTSPRFPSPISTPSTPHPASSTASSLNKYTALGFQRYRSPSWHNGRVL